MFCPTCGAKLPDDTRFCTACGAAIEKAAPTPETPGTPKRMRPLRPLTAIAIILSIIAVGIVGYLVWSTLAQPRTVQVSFHIDAPGYDATTDSKIPLHLSGTTSDGTSVDGDVYLGDTSDTVAVQPGSYTVTAPASPLMASGELFSTEGISVPLAIDQDGTVTTPSGDLSITYQPLDVGALGDDEYDRLLDASKRYAQGGGTSQDSIDSLVHRTQEHREQMTPATYTYTTESLAVGRTTFTYVQLESSKDNAALDELNTRLRQDAQRAADNYADASDASGQMYDNAYGAYDDKVTYCQDGIICILNIAYQTNGGAHGWQQVTPTIVNVDTGTLITAAEVVGLSDSSLNSLCHKALADDLARNPSDLYGTDLSRVLGGKGIADHVGSDLEYYLTPNGVRVWTGPYFMGSFASGYRNILVCDLTGAYASVGATREAPPTLDSTGTMTGARPSAR